PLEPEPLREPDDRRRERRPGIPVDKVQHDERAEVAGGPPERYGELPGQRRRDDAEHAGHEQYERPGDAVARAHDRQITTGAAQIELLVRGWSHKSGGPRWCCKR